jgi:aspartate racemase
MDKATAMMIDTARPLENGGVEFFLICSNTKHRVADAIAAAV